ncbi:MAG: EutN/CcmL family microcompartment protein [Elusimicrobiales bacterium]|nr:EutN/CcmL family microcompartment protein [Elusimicrobiales bacterium]
MFIAKVVGNVWATRKHRSLEGRKLMLVKPFSPETGACAGETTLAVDGGTGCGPGSVVLVLDEGGSARMILKDENAPVRTLVCGIIDSIDSKGKAVKYA